MHSIRFRLGSAPHPAAGAYSVPPDPLAGFKGAYTKGMGMGWEGRGEKRGREKGAGDTFK